jgi:ABC-type amino acid transport substrate-binding protein
MKKKLLSIFLSVAMAAAMLAGCGSSSSAPAESDATEKSTEAGVSSEESGEKIRYGVLSVLNITEDEYHDMDLARVKVGRIMAESDRPVGKSEVIFYDNLDAMQMALEAGDIDWMNVPKSTADYLIANNDKMQHRERTKKSEKLSENDKSFLERLSTTGFAFMMRGDSEKLRDDFDDAIEDMKEDGTLDKLIKEYITDVVDGKEPKAVEFEDKGDETIKVAVTGDLPPMDYVAADGSFAGFNTAILAEIGKRLNKKIELKQVDSAARAVSLSSNEVDVVFWTRVGTGRPDDDELEEMEKRQKQNISGEDDAKRKEIREALEEGGSRRDRDRMDMPEGTMVTDPYYTDRLVGVGLKK